MPSARLCRASACEQDIDYCPYGGEQNDYSPNVSQNHKFTGDLLPVFRARENATISFESSPIGAGRKDHIGAERFLECRRFCSGRSTEAQQRSTSHKAVAATPSVPITCGLQNSIVFNERWNLVRDQGVGGSNPLSPTNFFQHLNPLQCTARGFARAVLSQRNCKNSFSGTG